MNEPRAALARPLASVTTATVDVQVLRIGAKQMTLAVFRQLAHDDLIEGPMWGTVNYHHRLFPEPCRGYADKSHVHVVWQKGGELRHATVPLAPVNWRSHYQWAMDIARKVYEKNYGGYPPREQCHKLGHHLAFLSPDELTTWDRWVYARKERYTPEELEQVERLIFETEQTWSIRNYEADDAPILSLPQLFIAV